MTVSIFKDSDTAIRILATIAATGFGVFLFIILLLHFLNPEFDASKRYISEYALGSYNWLLYIAIIGNLTGCAALTLAFYVAYQRPYRSRFNIICLVIATLSVITNFFPTDIYGEAVTISGHIHNTGSFIGGIAIIIVMLNFSIKMKGLDLLRGTYKILPAIAILAPVAFLVLLIGADMMPGLIGVGQRIFAVIIMTWLVITSLGIRAGAIIPPNQL